MNAFVSFNRISLGRLIVALSVLALTVAAVLIVGLSEIVRDHAVRDLARTDARQISQLVFQSLYTAMRKGWNKAEIGEIIERQNRAMPNLRIRVYRGEIIERQFGAMPGERALIAADPPLAGALRDGRDSLSVSADGKSIRYLYPVQAKSECLVCHTQSHIGAVHGVIDITYPVDDLKVSFTYVINSIVTYALIAVALVFIFLHVKLHRLVVVPIANLVVLMQRIMREMNFQYRVDGNHWVLELHRLSKYFNRLLSTVQDYNSRLEELSVRDPLTNLYNRRKFEEFLNYEIARAERHVHPFSIIMIDLDNFKFINDTYGHPTGDMVLKELAALLGNNLRRNDMLARMGGDEFALILPETAATLGLTVATKLHQAVAEREFDLPVGKVRMTASFGVASYPDDGKTKDQIYSALDAVLYSVKRKGKNLVLTADAAQDRDAMNIFRRGDFLRQAMYEDRIEVFLQPIVDVRQGVVVAFEALARMRDHETVIPAAQFIEVAEELGMAKELDRIVFRKALLHLKTISRADPRAKMFFNLSARSLNDVDWMRSLPALVAEHGIACDKIVLEITEREALTNLSQIRTIIDELRQRDISFALDDFGSGFSSFLYLKYLSVDYVKIDGSFIQQIAIDDRDRIMVQHIHQIAREFGLKTVAEFVEDLETSQILAQIGVDYAQGYFFGYPVAGPSPTEE